MLVVRGRIADRQAIVGVGLRKLLVLPGQPAGHSPALSVPIKEYRALIDTGAEASCITRRAAMECDLEVFGFSQVQGVGGVKVHDVYLFYLGLWCEREDRRLGDDQERSYFGFPDAQEAVAIPDNVNFDVIIGMNVLQQLDFHMYRSGDFVLQIE